MIDLPAQLAALLDVGAAVFPPLIVALFVANSIRRTEPSSTRALDVERLAAARSEAADLDTLLKSVDASLEICFERTTRLAGAAGSEGGDLIANTARLTDAAAAFRASGIAVDATVDRLVGAVPELHRLASQTDATNDKLEGTTGQQIKVIDALLGSVQVRGDEVAAQADVAIASMIKQLAEVDEQSRQMTSRIAKRAYALDTAVDGASARAVALLDAVGERVGVQMTIVDERLAAARASLDAVGAHGVEITGQQLDHVLHTAGELSRLLTQCGEQGQHLHDATEGNLASLPDRLTTAQHLGEVAFGALAAHADTLAHRLDELQTPMAASNTSIDALQQRMGDLQRVADQFGATLATALPAATTQLRDLAGGTAALTGHVDALQVKLDAGQQATRQVVSLVGEARTELAALGAGDLNQVDDQIGRTAASVRNLGQQIAAQVTLTGETKAIVEGDLDAIHERLRLLQSDSESNLAAVSAHIGEVSAAMGGLTDPIGIVQQLLDDIGAQVTNVADTTTALEHQLDRRLAATTASFAALDERAAGLIEQTAALRAATAEEAQVIAVASDIFARERVAFASAAAGLAVKFEHARAVLDELDSATARVSAGTAEQLGQTFERVRVLADASSSALGGMLERIIREAEVTLERSGTAMAEAAFGVPIRRELLAVETAADRAGVSADAAAQRVAGQARAMTVKIDEVDAKVDEIETRLDVRTRDTLSARSTRLIEMLNAASVDIARLLSVDAGEKAWLRYLKGDRSIFARRIVSIVDRPTRAKIARHYTHDEAFRTEASHYLDLFEKLSRRLMSDPEGDTLLATIVSSDIGKLYVVIARATERWSPAA